LLIDYEAIKDHYKATKKRKQIDCKARVKRLQSDRKAKVKQLEGYFERNQSNYKVITEQ
jgi:hypothetical protein